jgi:hypothetical protein
MGLKQQATEETNDSRCAIVTALTLAAFSGTCQSGGGVESSHPRPFASGRMAMGKPALALHACASTGGA